MRKWMTAIAVGITTMGLLTAPAAEARPAPGPAIQVRPQAVGDKPKVEPHTVPAGAATTNGGIGYSNCHAYVHDNQLGYNSDRQGWCSWHWEYLDSVATGLNCAQYMVTYEVRLADNASNYDATVWAGNWTLFPGTQGCQSVGSSVTYFGVNTRDWVNGGMHASLTAGVSRTFTLAGRTFKPSGRDARGNYVGSGYPSLLLSTSNTAVGALEDFQVGDVMRCDRSTTAGMAFNTPEACRFFTVIATYSFFRSEFPHVWLTAYNTIQLGGPKQLTRVWNASTWYINNRKEVTNRCTQARYPGSGDCDEYPYASTLQGMSNPRYVHGILRVPSYENQLAGTNLGQFYDSQRIFGSMYNTGDTFQVWLRP